MSVIASARAASRQSGRGRSGRHDDPGAVEALAGRSFEVVTDRPMRVNTDGEITTRTPARFSVVPAALEVLVPAPPPGDET